jgi:hypothetical protein
LPFNPEDSRDAAAVAVFWSASSILVGRARAAARHSLVVAAAGRFLDRPRGALRRLAAGWRTLDQGAADELTRSRVERGFPEARAVVRASRIVRALEVIGDRLWSAARQAHAVRFAADRAREWHALTPAARVRLVGLLLLAAVAIRAATVALVPHRLAPRLPSSFWFLTTAIAIALVLGWRMLAAAWVARPHVFRRTES